MVEASMDRNAPVWSVAEAKARFSEVIDRALKQGPQAITRNGRPAVVVVSSEEWARRAGRKGTLADFFAASPLPKSGLEIERPRGGAREVDL
jgi:prevent-host-death family protein